jgi:hypothetical protein
MRTEDTIFLEAQRTTSYISTEVTADFNFSVKESDLNRGQKYR